jgi:hypothetical protein
MTWTQAAMLFIGVLVLCYAVNVLAFGGGDPRKGPDDNTGGGWG